MGTHLDVLLSEVAGKPRPGIAKCGVLTDLGAPWTRRGGYGTMPPCHLDLLALWLPAPVPLPNLVDAARSAQRS